MYDNNFIQDRVSIPNGDYIIPKQVKWDKSEDSCLHKQCPRCHGTGVQEDGSVCVHMISCPCPGCIPRC